MICEIILDIPMATPSLNQVMRWHWAKRKKMQKEWAYMILVSYAKMGFKRPESGMENPVHISIERFGKRDLDYDNLVGGAKEVVTDNLVRMNFIEDDSPKHAEFFFENHTLAKGKNPMTKITMKYYLK